MASGEPSSPVLTAQAIRFAPLPILAVRPDGALSHVNAEAQRLFGYDPSGDPIWSLGQLITEQEWPTIRDTLDDQTRRLFRRTSTTAHGPQELAVLAWRVHDEDVQEVFMVLRPALSEDRARRAFGWAEKLIDLGAWEWEVGTREVWWSPQLYRIYGRDPQDGPPGDDWLEYIHPEDREQIPAAIARSIETGHYEAEFRIVRPDGTQRWVRALGETRSDDDGRTRQLGVVLDITEQHAAEQLQLQLEQAQRLEALGRLAGGVAHDFNNLLMAILGGAQLALESLDDPERVRVELEQIRQLGDRATDLTGKLLAFGRRQTIDLVSIDLNATVRDIAPLLNRLLTEQVECELKLGADVPSVLADRGHIERVLVNLALNARDAMSEGGRLIISTDEVTGDTLSDDQQSISGAFVRMIVQDTGHGIPADVLPYIFEPFFTTKGSDGSGLGLPSVHGIMAQGGGHVLVRSTVDEGTAFWLLFPIAESPAVPDPARPAGASIESGNERILVVEDDTAVGDIVGRALARRGFQVTRAAKIQDARSALEKHTFELMISDVVLPDGNGHTLAQEVRNTRPKIKILLMSGYAKGVTTQTDLPMLKKPFSVQELRQAVRRALTP